MSQPDSLVHTILLADGRRLGYARFGAESGPVVLYCHGFPASRLEAALADAAAARLGLVLLAPDRPGYGLSSHLAGRRILDWPADVQALCAALGLTRFSVLGVSGGAPYALACAHVLADRVDRLALVGGLAPIGSAADLAGMGGLARAILQFSLRRPKQAERLWRLLHVILRRAPETAFALIRHTLPTADRGALRDPAVRTALLASFREGARQGATGSARDLILYGRDWGFDVSAVRAPCAIWHGEADRTVPVTMAHTWAMRLPDADMRILPGEGHFSLPLRYMHAILAGLKA